MNPDKSRFLLLLPLAGLLAAAPLRAADLFWSVSIFTGHRLSTGQPLPAGTRFQIGTFTGGFVPTSGNTADWTLHWQPAGDVAYDPDFQGFGGVLRMEENPAPFLAGAQLYIWGFVPTGAAASEWILGTRPSWITPAADPFAFPVFIDLADGDFILGSVDPSSRAITTAFVPTGTGPLFPYEWWTFQYFFLVERGDPAISGPEADPDGDGLSNALEHALGTDPRSASQGLQNGGLAIAKNGTNAVTVSFPGVSSVPPAAIQTSTTLATGSWTPVFPALSYDLTSGRWNFTQTTGEARRFWRIGGPP